jgi:DNA polymerase III subunit gamma/tau
MGIALYRKYRPQVFADVTGQNHIRVTLENELSAGSVAHAYLFTGPRGVGKTSLARIFAKALNCLNRKEGESEPCNACEACEEMKGGRSLDVIEIDAASNTGVDNVRENVIEHVRFAPVSRKRKVFIIDEVHMLSSSAWNALLKTLEEPPAHAVFIMATTEIHKVPATIISRCQRFDFRRIAPSLMAERLKRMASGEGVEVDGAVIDAVAKLGDGCLRDAESLLEQVLSLDVKRIGTSEASLVLPHSDSELVAAFVDALAGRRGADAIGLIAKLIEEGIDLQQFTNEAIEHLRGLLISGLGASSADGHAAPGESARRMDVAHIIRLINSLMAARLELKSAVIPQLPLELVVAENCGDAAPAETAPVIARSVKAQALHVPTSEATCLPERQAKQPQDRAARPRDDEKKGGAAAPEAEKGGAIGPSQPDALPVEKEKPSAPVATADPVPPVASMNPASGGPIAAREVPLDTLALRWDELCAVVQEENPSLPFLLRVSRPLRFEDGFLVIGVQYKLHADKLNQPKNRDMISRGLTSLYEGANIPVRAEITAPPSGNSGAVTDSLLKQFGGTVVE